MSISSIHNTLYAVRRIEEHMVTKEDLKEFKEEILKALSRPAMEEENVSAVRSLENETSLDT